MFFKHIVTKEYKQAEMQNILIKIVKKFTLNEIEILLYSLYLDKLKWEKEKFFTIEEFLSVIALFLKLRLIENGNSYISYIGINNQDLIIKLNDFLEIKQERKFNFKIHSYELNDKFKELSKVI